MRGATIRGRLVVGALLFLALIAVAGSSPAGFKVTEAPPTCRNAHALLVASKRGWHKVVWREIGKVATSDPNKWEVVDDYQPGVVRKVSFRQYQVRNREGMTAYVVHCGHGGTCNELTQAFFKVHPDWYSPTVYCGSIPEMLHSPVAPDLASL